MNQFLKTILSNAFAWQQTFLLFSIVQVKLRNYVQYKYIHAGRYFLYICFKYFLWICFQNEIMEEKQNWLNHRRKTNLMDGIQMNNSNRDLRKNTKNIYTNYKWLHVITNQMNSFEHSIPQSPVHKKERLNIFYEEFGLYVFYWIYLTWSNSFFTKTKVCIYMHICWSMYGVVPIHVLYILNIPILIDFKIYFM